MRDFINRTKRVARMLPIIETIPDEAEQKAGNVQSERTSEVASQDAAEVPAGSNTTPVPLFQAAELFD
jgi:hypothetical protein